MQSELSLYLDGAELEMKRSRSVKRKNKGAPIRNFGDYYWKRYQPFPINYTDH